ncbi:MAG: hypothetical protein R3Y27_04105 [Clostridia bacterium]
MKNNNSSLKSGLIYALIALLIFASGNLVGSLTSSKTDVNSTTTQTTTVQESTTQTQTQTTTQAQSSTQASQDVTQENSQTQEESTFSTEEIAELFNTATNNAKTKATQITQEYKNVFVDPEKLIMPSAVQSISEAAMNNFVTGESEPISYTTSEEIIANFPVYDSAVGSSVQASDLTSATCTDNGDTYSVELIFADCTNPAADEGTNSAFPTLNLEGMGNAPVINNLVVEYTNCSITAEIDKATGNLISATYIMPFSMQFEVSIGFSFDVGAGIDYEYNYSITY